MSNQRLARMLEQLKEAGENPPVETIIGILDAELSRIADGLKEAEREIAALKWAAKWAALSEGDRAIYMERQVEAGRAAARRAGDDALFTFGRRLESDGFDAEVIEQILRGARAAALGVARTMGDNLSDSGRAANVAQVVESLRERGVTFAISGGEVSLGPVELVAPDELEMLRQGKALVRDILAAEVPPPPRIIRANAAVAAGI